jgi:hypothetical protein
MYITGYELCRCLGVDDESSLQRSAAFNPMTEVVEDIEEDGVLKGNGVVVMDNDMDSGWNILIYLSSYPSLPQCNFIYYMVDIAKWITSARGEMLCFSLVVGGLD